MADIIQLKRGKSTTWKNKNLLLLAGEPGFEVDTYRLKIGDGKTAWNDLPYIGTTGSGPIVLPDNIMSYLGKVTSFPETAKEGSTCIYNDKLYIYTNGDWIGVSSEDVNKHLTFNSLVDAIDYVNSHNYVGQIISIFQNNKWLPYIVDVNNNLIPIQYGEDDYDILNGGDANTLN